MKPPQRHDNLHAPLEEADGDDVLSSPAGAVRIPDGPLVALVPSSAPPACALGPDGQVAVQVREDRLALDLLALLASLGGPGHESQQVGDER